MLTEYDLMNNAQAFYAEHGFLLIASPVPLAMGSTATIFADAVDSSVNQGFPVKITATSTREEALKYRESLGYGYTLPPDAPDYFYRVEVLD